MLGGDFVPKLLALIPGEWSGPLQSGFGYHLVQVTDHIKGRIPALVEIRESVLQECQMAEREKYLRSVQFNMNTFSGSATADILDLAGSVASSVTISAI